MTSHSVPSEQDAPHFHGEALAIDTWANTSGPRIVFGFAAFFAFFLLVMELAGQVPGKSFALKSASDIFQFVGEGIGCFFCVRIALRLRKAYKGLRRELIEKEIGRKVAKNLEADRAETQAAYRAYLAWLLLAIAIGCYVAGQIVWTSYDMRMNSANVPFPGLYDLGFVSSYAFFLAGTLLLTRRSKAAMRQGFLLLDALAVIGASLALSWFFLLGPALTGLPQAPGPLAAFLSLYFPTGDLFLVAIGAFLMFSPLSNRAQQPVFLLLCTGLFFLAIADSLLSYYNLSSGFNTGTFQDILWPASMQLIGLAAIMYPNSIAYEQALGEDSTNTAGVPARGSSQLIAITLSILPLILVLLTCALLLLRITPRGGVLAIQSNLVVLTLVLILVGRQALTLVENNRLITQVQNELALSQSELRRKKREAEEAMRRAQEKQELEEGVAALRAVHTRITRGDYTARVPAVSGPLQQIAVSLNMMLDQLSANAQQSVHYKQLVRELRMTQEAIERFEQGLPPWPSRIPPTGSSGELRAILLGLLHIYSQQANQWRGLKTSLNSVHKLARHLRETLSKIRQADLFTASRPAQAENMVVELAIKDAAILEEQQQNVLNQVTQATLHYGSATSHMSILEDTF